MPSRDLHSHHDQLVEDKDGERNADHAREDSGVVCADADKELREALDHGALVDGHGDPDEEALVAQTAAGFELGVELGVEVCDALIDVAVEHEREDGRHRVDG